MKYEERRFGFGLNKNGRLGIGNKELIVNSPQKISFPSKIIRIATNFAHTLALDQENKIFG